MDAAEADI